MKWPFRRDDSDGFRMESSGRAGTITFRKAGYVLALDFEMSGGADCDILLAPVDLRRWAAPAGDAIPRTQQLEILELLRAWLGRKGLRSDIDAPTANATTGACGRAGCSATPVQGSAYCRAHYDLNLLRDGLRSSHSVETD